MTSAMEGRMDRPQRRKRQWSLLSALDGAGPGILSGVLLMVITITSTIIYKGIGLLERVNALENKMTSHDTLVDDMKERVVRSEGLIAGIEFPRVVSRLTAAESDIAAMEAKLHTSIKDYFNGESRVRHIKAERISVIDTNGAPVASIGRGTSQQSQIMLMDKAGNTAVSLGALDGGGCLQVYDSKGIRGQLIVHNGKAMLKLSADEPQEGVEISARDGAASIEASYDSGGSFLSMLHFGGSRGKGLGIGLMNPDTRSTWSQLILPDGKTETAAVVSGETVYHAIPGFDAGAKTALGGDFPKVIPEAR